MNINISSPRFYCKLILTGFLLLISTNSPAQYYDHIPPNILRAESSLLFIKWDLIIVGIVALLIILSLAYVSLQQKQQSGKQLQLKQKEISEQNQILQHLTADKNRLLDEKDWLLKEVHHRVKNNLQIVMSLLNTQSAFLKNNAALAAIRESQNRVQAIALIHQKLYSSSNVAYIDIAVYISELVNYLADCYDAHDRGIRFEQQIEPVKMDVAQAVPVGLMLNEAITNAIKYAFPHRRGYIDIRLGTFDDNNIMLSIADNGIGLPQGFDIKEASSLGMEMMKALSKQLGGNFKMENNEGVVITLVFRAEKNFGNIENEYYPI
ncbi:sensor histidine kinase [Mucilaginibacter sp. cycad4]|uniref:sensor histidine kinase n=1 Tax=Mucilaginibacter sp. cycad4 TaxID=3342096 RepID=UPI002AAA6413|nr:sensor histidine kinase [Mucilaginibacter gossypii]WPU97304.1 sensor histidine kinase [Mucilaginibacter gossypii]